MGDKMQEFIKSLETQEDNKIKKDNILFDALEKAIVSSLRNAKTEEQAKKIVYDLLAHTLTSIGVLRDKFPEYMDNELIPKIKSQFEKVLDALIGSDNTEDFFTEMVNELHSGDCLDIMKGIPDNSIDLIYLDPPFFTQKDWGEFDDRWKTLEDYIEFLRERAVEMRRILKDTGSLYLHCDINASHYIKVMLDQVFGMKNFRNEIVWRRSGPKGTKWARKSYGVVNDIIYFYSKTTQTEIIVEKILPAKLPKFPYQDKKGKYRLLTPLYSNPGLQKCRELTWQGQTPKYGWKYSEDTLNQFLADDRIHYKNDIPYKKQYDFEYEGVAIDNIWMDISVARGKERSGYPTQKPVKLLERILRASSKEGDVVLDPFCGSGTTIIAAQNLNRNYIGIDANENAINIVKQRLIENRSGLTLKLC